MRHKIMTTTLVCLAVASAASAREKKSPLPDAAHVKTISIEFDHPTLDDVEFTATPEDWKAIRATLLPATPDQKPAKWEWLGTVRMIQKDNQPFRVELYTTSKDPGAFAAGKTYKQRVYYRGGKTAELVRAVHAAYERFKKNK
jgi:hypothetical protein